MTASDKDFDSLVKHWNRVCGKDAAEEDFVRNQVQAQIRVCSRDMKATKQEDTQFGGRQLAYPDGVPMTWDSFKKLVIKPGLERREALLKRIEDGKPFV